MHDGFERRLLVEPVISSKQEMGSLYCWEEEGEIG